MKGKIINEKYSRLHGQQHSKRYCLIQMRGGATVSLTTKSCPESLYTRFIYNFRHFLPIFFFGKWKSQLILTTFKFLPDKPGFFAETLLFSTNRNNSLVFKSFFLINSSFSISQAKKKYKWFFGS